jgi:hypothetical protein
MDIDLSDNFWNPTELVSESHNTNLCKEFSKKEIRDAVFGSYAEGALGLMGSLFYSINISGIWLNLKFWLCSKTGIWGIWICFV